MIGQQPPHETYFGIAQVLDLAALTRLDPPPSGAGSLSS